MIKRFVRRFIFPKRKAKEVRDALLRGERPRGEYNKGELKEGLRAALYYVGKNGGEEKVARVLKGDEVLRGLLKEIQEDEERRWESINEKCRNVCGIPPELLPKGISGTFVELGREAAVVYYLLLKMRTLRILMAVRRVKELVE